MNLYFVCLLVGFLLVQVSGAWFARRANWSIGRVLAVVSLAGIATIVGARLTYVVTRWPVFAERPFAALVSAEAGFVLSGGLAAATITGLIVASWLKVDPWKLADGLAPSIGLAIAVARLGCFYQGCCHGIESNWPCAVRYPIGSPAFLDQMARGRLFMAHESLPVHPTQVYELVAAFLGSAVAAWLGHSGRFPSGAGGLFFAIWFIGIHGLNHSLRAASSMRPDWAWILPALDVGLVLIAFVLLLTRRRRAAITASPLLP